MKNIGGEHMLRIKKILLLVLAGIITVSMGMVTFAAESHNVNQGVSANPPVEIQVEPLGLGKPDKSDVVDLTKGTLSFSGSAERSTLYTNSHFKGKSKISYSITNDCDKKLTVKIYTASGWFKSKSISVEANATLTGTIDGLDKDTLYYLTFSAPSDFSGSVY